ncbi:MAG: hypothetical protein EZS28_038227, partial [Streblomastix strix]
FQFHRAVGFFCLLLSTLTYGEKLVAIRNTVEGAGALQHVFLDLMYQITLGRSEHFMDKLVDRYKLALLATGDAQRIREQTTGGTCVKPDKSEILSETTKQKMNEQKKMKKGNFNLPRSGSSRFNSSELVAQNQNSQRQIMGFPRQKELDQESKNVPNSIIDGISIIKVNQ